MKRFIWSDFVCTRKIISFVEQRKQLPFDYFCVMSTNSLKLAVTSQLSTLQQSLGYSRYCLFLHNFVYTRRNLAVPINGCPTLCELTLIACRKVRFKSKFCFYILAFTWIMSGLFRAWNPKYMSKTKLKKIWIETKCMYREQLSEKTAAYFIYRFCSQYSCFFILIIFFAPQMKIFIWSVFVCTR